MKKLIAVFIFSLPLCAQNLLQQPNALSAPLPVSTDPSTISAQHYSRVFQDPRRDHWQQPDAMVTAMALASTDTAAELGSGTGYFGRRMALKAKKVYVIDDDKAVLAQAALEAPPNLSTILADKSSLHIPPNSIDKLVINGLLELSVDEVAFLAQLQSGLKPTARVYIVDFFQSPNLRLPDKYSIALLTGVFQLFGFRLLQDLSIVSNQDLLIFGH
jgi:ubiquinone/menaquinone biosynthesis C-methylase UbiE